MCHWKVKFKAAALYEPATSVREGCFLQVTPHAHRGKADMVEMAISEATRGKNGRGFRSSFA